MSKRSRFPEWETLLAYAALVQARLPGAILVGGTAVAVHARHRISSGHDHVIKDLARHYDTALSTLESIVGWRTHRRVRGKLVLGGIDGIDAGLRNQKRSAPLETTSVELPDGRTLRLPTIQEMLRIKAYLMIERNATRDFLDVAAMSHHLGLAQSVRALESMNELHADFAGEGGEMLSSIVAKLSNPEPYDLTGIDLAEYKGIVAPWNDWHAVVAQCRSLAVALLQPSA